MALPDLAQQALKDPDFKNLPFEEKRKFLGQVIPELGGLEHGEQVKFMNQLNVGAPEDHPVVDAAKDLAKATIRPALEAGGMVAGGAAALPLGPVAAFAGGAGGFAAGKEGADLAERALNLPDAPKAPGSIPEAVAQTGSDLQSGALNELAGQGLAKVGEVGAQFLKGPFAKKMGEAGANVAQHAKDLGINLTPAEITRSKGLAMLEKLLDYTPFSADVVQNYKLEQLQGLIKVRNRLLDAQGANQAAENLGFRIQEAADNYMRTNVKASQDAMTGLKDRLLKKLGSTDSYEELGMTAQDALKKRSVETMQKASDMYSAVKDQIPPDMKQVPENLQRTAEQLLARENQLSPALRDPQLNQVLTQLAPPKPPPPAVDPNVEEMLKNLSPKAREAAQAQMTAMQPPVEPIKPPEMSWEQLNGHKSAFGDLIRQNDPGTKANVEGMRMTGDRVSGAYRKLAGAADQDLQAFAEKAGSGAKDTLDLANAFYKGEKRLMDKPYIQRLARVNPEKVLDVAFKPNSASVVDDVKTAVGPEAFDRLKRKFTNRLLDTGTTFDPQGVLANLHKYGDETLGKIYNKKEMDALVQLGQKGTQLDAEAVQNPFFKRLVRLSPEKVVDYVVKPGNVENIRQVRMALGDEGETNLRQAFLGKILGENQHGVFSPMKFHSQLTKYGDRTLKELFPEDLYSEVKKLGDVSLRSTAADKLAGNPSGTAQNLINFQMGRAILTNPVNGVAMTLPNVVVAKLYLHPATRAWLTSAMEVPATTKAAIGLYSRLAAYAAKPGDLLKDEDTPVYADEVTKKLGPQTAQVTPQDQSRAHYRAGLDAFLNRDTATARKNWATAKQLDPQNRDAAQGLVRLEQKNKPVPPVSKQSRATYRDGLQAFLDKDPYMAEKKWTLALKQDPNNLEAQRGLQRLQQKRQDETAVARRP